MPTRLNDWNTHRETSGAAAADSPLMYNSPGTATFTAGDTAVSGSATTWSSQLAPGWWIKREADGADAWTEIDTVDSNTALTLVEGYKGTSGGPGKWEAFDANVFAPHPIGDLNSAFEAHGYETVLVYWLGTGGNLTDTIDLEMLIWDGIAGGWTRFETIQLEQREIGEFKVHHSARCFLRIAAEATTATDVNVYVAGGAEARVVH